MIDPDRTYVAPPDVGDDAKASELAAPAYEPRAGGFARLEDVIADESFPEVDLALRRGRHIHKGDERWYEFLLDAQSLLEAFYRRYGCALEQRSDGYFFLLPITDSLGKRHLGVAEMIVGQGLALCYLEPHSVQSGGVVTREELLNQLAAVMGTDALMRSLNPKRKRVDERVMQRTVRNKVNDALRRLGQLGFVELIDGERLQLRPSLMRFAEPVRGLDAPSEALKRLIERGEISLGPGDPEPDADVDVDADADADVDAETDVDAEAGTIEGGTGASVAPDTGDDPDDATEVVTPDTRENATAELSAHESDADRGDAYEPEALDASAMAFETDDGETAELEPDRDGRGSDDPIAPPEVDFEWDTLPGEEPRGEEA